MKNLITILFIMTTFSSIAQLGKATTENKTFSRTTTISEEIQSDAAIVWSLLTNAADFARWNSTVVSLEGDIQKGEKIQRTSFMRSRTRST